MAKRTKKGLPKSMAEAIELAEEDHRAEPDEPTLETFITEMHGAPPEVQGERTWPTKDWLQSQFQTKSAIIRFLVSEGFAIKDIARNYGFKYQHVRNVATNNLKRGPNEDWRKPYLEGSTIPDIKKFKPEN